MLVIVYTLILCIDIQCCAQNCYKRLGTENIHFCKKAINNKSRDQQRQFLLDAVLMSDAEVSFSLTLLYHCRGSKVCTYELSLKSDSNE